MVMLVGRHGFPRLRHRPLSLVGNYRMKDTLTLEPITVTLAQIRELTGLSRSSVYRMFDSGLPRKKLRGKTLVLMTDLRAYLDTELKAA